MRSEFCVNVSSEERAMNVAVSEITTLWVSNGNRLRETHPFLKQKTKQESPGEEKQGQRRKQGTHLCTTTIWSADVGVCPRLPRTSQSSSFLYSSFYPKVTWDAAWLSRQYMRVKSCVERVITGQTPVKPVWLLSAELVAGSIMWMLSCRNALAAIKQLGQHHWPNYTAMVSLLHISLLYDLHL